MTEAGESHEAARLAKLHAIEALGIDPWGARFDGHMPVASVRALPVNPEAPAPARIAGRVVLRRVMGRAGSPMLASVYGRWHKEIFADLAAILLGGPAAAWGMADFLAVLYFHELAPQDVDFSRRDRQRFYLSTGHYSIALWAVLAGGSVSWLLKARPKSTPASKPVMQGKN